MRWWRLRDRALLDLRLGYGALGVGALAFMAVLAATLVVKDVVVPALTGPGTVTAQRVVSAAAIAREIDTEPADGGSTDPAPVIEIGRAHV